MALSGTQGPGLRRGRPAIFVFLALGFTLSWYPWAIAFAMHRGNGGPNPLGLLVAALIASAVAGGWPGIKRLALSIARVRAPLGVWAVALLLPIACLAVAIFAAAQTGTTIATKPVPWSDLLDRFVFTFLFVALGEEPAWRGFLLPQLQARWHPLAATLGVAAIWAVWHLPLMGTEFAWPLVPAFLVSLLGGAFVLSWLYNASRSVLPGMFTHALINTVGAGYVFTLIAPDQVARFWWIYAAIWLGAGLLTVVLTRGRLGAPPEAS